MSYVDYENQLLCKEINEQARLFKISAEKEEEIAAVKSRLAARYAGAAGCCTR